MISIVNINEGWEYEQVIVVTYKVDNKEDKLIIPNHVAKAFKTFPMFFRFIVATIKTRESMQ